MKTLVLPLIFAAALPAAGAQLFPAMNAFTTDVYHHVAANDGNLILSPFNIGAALSMVLAGARGRTAGEIQAVLHFHYDSAHDASLGALLDQLGKEGSTGGNELLLANGLWVQKGFAVLPAFEKTLAGDYHAPPTPVDFIANAGAARAQINAWTEENTKGKIKNLFPAGVLNSRTRLVLTSAIYFYGKWQNPFVTARTQPASFTPLDGAAVQAPFMNQTARFGYAETPSAQVLEMPYAGTGMSFDVLLPKAAAGLPDLEKSLTADSLTGWLGRLSAHQVKVSLPKFRAEASFSLGNTLAAMGMRTAFTDAADFSGISARGGLALSEVIHKAFVDVSEEGTEAAAATGIGVHATALRLPEDVVVFRADHPFLFLIRDTHRGTILFIGRFVKP